MPIISALQLNEKGDTHPGNSEGLQTGSRASPRIEPYGHLGEQALQNPTVPNPHIAERDDIPSVLSKSIKLYPGMLVERRLRGEHFTLRTRSGVAITKGKSDNEKGQHNHRRMCWRKESRMVRSVPTDIVPSVLRILGLSATSKLLGLRRSTMSHRPAITLFSHALRH